MISAIAALSLAVIARIKKGEGMLVFLKESK